MTKLRAWREAARLTVAQLASAAGVPAKTVADWEEGRATPGPHRVGQLALALGLTPEAVRAALAAGAGEGRADIPDQRAARQAAARGERAAAWPETDADTSGGEYLSRDDRTKAHGYNHLPHRPRRPDQRRQAAEARHVPTTRATRADDAGEREGAA